MRCWPSTHGGERVPVRPQASDDVDQRAPSSPSVRRRRRVRRPAERGVNAMAQARRLMRPALVTWKRGALIFAR